MEKMNINFPTTPTTTTPEEVSKLKINFPTTPTTTTPEEVSKLKINFPKTPTPEEESRDDLTWNSLNYNATFINDLLKKFTKEDLEKGALTLLLNGSTNFLPDDKMVNFPNIPLLPPRKLANRIFAAFRQDLVYGSKLNSERIKDSHKFYLSMDGSNPVSTRFLEELYDLCKEKNIKLRWKISAQSYANPIVYTDDGENMIKFLSDLKNKYPRDIWLDIPRYLQAPIPEVNPNHVTYVYEPRLPFDFFGAHSDRMALLGKFIQREVLKGVRFDIEMYKKAAMYAGVDPSKPYALNPSILKNISDLTYDSKRLDFLRIEFTNITGELNKLVIQNKENYKFLSRKEIQELILIIREKLDNAEKYGLGGYIYVYEAGEFLNEVKRFLNSTSPESITSII